MLSVLPSNLIVKCAIRCHLKLFLAVSTLTSSYCWCHHPALLWPKTRWITQTGFAGLTFGRCLCFCSVGNWRKNCCWTALIPEVLQYHNFSCICICDGCIFFLLFLSSPAAPCTILFYPAGPAEGFFLPRLFVQWSGSGFTEGTDTQSWLQKLPYKWNVIKLNRPQKTSKELYSFFPG